MIATKQRSDRKEWMDDLNLKGPELRDTLNILGRINTWLGGDRITVNAIKRILKQDKFASPLSILDLGCGHGQQLRYIVDFCRKHGIAIDATGVDANKDCVDYAIECSVNYPEIRYLRQDAFDQKNLKSHYELVIATLFVHHLSNAQLIALLESYKRIATKAIIINDLHRSKIAYILFYALSLFIKNKMIVHDGLVSILRGFKRKDLIEYSNQLESRYSLRWMWAFRFQWILYT